MVQLDEFKCEVCERIFKYEDGLELHKQAKHSKPEKKEPLIKISSGQKKKFIKTAIALVVLIAVIGFVYYIITIPKVVLPPITIQGHIEQKPSSHILKEPMELRVQKHMLEHADGTGPPGIIINYNCEDFNCEPDLILNLEKFAKKYPVNVYVAPFNGMTEKIVLTKFQKLQKLDNYDEKLIENFIKN